MKKWTVLFLLLLSFSPLFSQTFDIGDDDSCRAVLCSKAWIRNGDTAHKIIFYKDETFLWTHSKGTWSFDGPATSYSGKIKDTRKIMVIFETVQQGNDVSMTPSTQFELVDGCKLFGTTAGKRNGNINKPSLCGPAGDTRSAFCFFQEDN